MPSEGIFRIRLLDAKFPKDRQFGSSDVYLLFQHGDLKFTIPGNGYDFQSDHLEKKVIIFDYFPILPLKIYGSINQCMPESTSPKVFGEVNLEELRSQPKVKHSVRVFCVEKQGEVIKHQDSGVIDLEIIYNQKMDGLLQITVESAFLTRDTEVIGKMDPYAKLSIDEVIHRTSVKDNAGKTPVWNQKFDFQIHNTDTKLIVQIKDKDMTVNDLVGAHELKLKQEGFFDQVDVVAGRSIPIYFDKEQSGTVNILTKFTFK